MIVLAGTLRVPREHIEAMGPRLVSMVAASRAEPGALYYSLAWDPTEPDLVRVCEIFRGMAALEAHRASPHMKEWRAHTQGFVRDLTLYDATERPPA